MIIRLKKGKDGGGTMTCVRDDGSTTWQHVTPYFVLHDLMHYAVESTLGYTQAFLSLVAGGRDLTEFDKGARDWLPVEAHWAEIVAGQVQLAGAGSLDQAEIEEGIRLACEGLGVVAPAITAEDVQAIQTVHRTLLGDWLVLRPGESLELIWPPAGIGSQA
jgi:hypothetical protein